MATYKHNKADVNKWLSEDSLIEDGNGNGNGNSETEPTKKRMKFFAGKSSAGGETKYDPKVKVEWHISASPIREKKPVEEKEEQEKHYAAAFVPRKGLGRIFGQYKQVKSKSVQKHYEEKRVKHEKERAEKGITYVPINPG